MTLARAHDTDRLGSHVVTIAERLNVARHTSRLDPSVQAFETVGKPVVPFERVSDRQLQLDHGLLSTSMHLDEGGIAGDEPEHAPSLADEMLQIIRSGPTPIQYFSTKLP
jgi:hypothetical protein